MATIIHFDISADNPIRVKEFYEKLFGRKFQLRPATISYYLIETRDLEGKTEIGGGIAKLENSQQAGITNFVGVASLDDSIKKVKELGGAVIQPKQLVPGWGYLTLCTDTENNLFGLSQEDKNAK